MRVQSGGIGRVRRTGLRVLWCLKLSSRSADCSLERRSFFLLAAPPSSSSLPPPPLELRSHAPLSRSRSKDSCIFSLSRFIMPMLLGDDRTASSNSVVKGNWFMSMPRGEDAPPWPPEENVSTSPSSQPEQAKQSKHPHKWPSNS